MKMESRRSASDLFEIPLRQSASSMTQTDPPNLSACGWRNHFLSVFVCPTICNPLFNLRYPVNHLPLPYYQFHTSFYNSYEPFNIANPSPPVPLMPMLMPAIPSLPPATCNSDWGIASCCTWWGPQKCPLTKHVTQSDEENNTFKCHESACDKRSNNNHKVKLFKRLEQKYLKNKASEAKTNKCHSADAFLYSDSLNSNLRRSKGQGSSLSFPLSTEKRKETPRRPKAMSSNNNLNYKPGIQKPEDSVSTHSDCNYNNRRNPIIKSYVNRISEKDTKAEKVERAKNIHELANLLCDFNVEDEYSNELNEIIRTSIDEALRENIQPQSDATVDVKVRSDLEKIKSSRHLKLSSDLTSVRDIKPSSSEQKYMKMLYSNSKNTNKEIYTSPSSSKLDLWRSLSSTSTVKSQIKSYSEENLKAQSISAERLHPRVNTSEDSLNYNKHSTTKINSDIVKPSLTNSKNNLNEFNHVNQSSSSESILSIIKRNEGIEVDDKPIKSFEMLPNLEQGDIHVEQSNDSEDINKLLKNITAHFIIPNCDTAANTGKSNDSSTAEGKRFSKISFSVNYDPKNPEMVMVDCKEDGRHLNELTVGLERSKKKSDDRAKDFMESIKNIINTNFYMTEPDSIDGQDQKNVDGNLIEEEPFQENNVDNQMDLSTQSAKKRLNKLSQYSILQNLDTLSVIPEEDDDSTLTNATYKSTTTISSRNANLTDNHFSPDTNVFANRIELMNLHNP